MITFVVWVLASLVLAGAVFLVANVMERRDGDGDGTSAFGRFWRDFASGLRRQERRRTVSAPVDTDMDEFFAATIESAPGYVDADELSDVLHRARVQARSTLHVGTVHRPDAPPAAVPQQQVPEQQVPQQSFPQQSFVAGSEARAAGE